MAYTPYRCTHCGLTPKQEKTKCAGCGTEYYTARGKMYCSAACKQKAYRNKNNGVKA